MAKAIKAREKIIRNGLTAKYLRQTFDYDPNTGNLRWKVRRDARTEVNAVRAGKIAGALNNTGAIRVCINNSHYEAHCIIWTMVKGKPAKNEVDHKNGIRSDNRISNLRAATHAQNLRNMKGRAKSGFKGVHLHVSGLWYAIITVNYRRISLGYYKTKELAYKAYCEGAKKHHGKFARFK